LILGYVFFGEWPDRLALIGAAIIVGTGAFTLYRQRASRKVKPA
jgi:S-adenosylmethionine uptake transporter